MDAARASVVGQFDLDLFRVDRLFGGIAVAPGGLF
jgi:hypothetical protein